MSLPTPKNFRLSECKGISEQGIKDIFDYSGIIDESYLEKTIWWWRKLKRLLKDHKIGTLKDFQYTNEHVGEFPLRFLEDLKIHQENNQIGPVLNVLFEFELISRLDPGKSWTPAYVARDVYRTLDGVPVHDSRYPKGKLKKIHCKELKICLNYPDKDLKKQFLAFVERKRNEHGIEKKDLNLGQVNRLKYDITAKFNILETFDKITLLGQYETVLSDDKSNLRKIILKFLQDN